MSSVAELRVGPGGPGPPKILLAHPRAHLQKNNIITQNLDENLQNIDDFRIHIFFIRVWFNINEIENHFDNCNAIISGIGAFHPQNVEFLKFNSVLLSIRVLYFARYIKKLWGRNLIKISSIMDFLDKLNKHKMAFSESFKQWRSKHNGHPHVTIITNLKYTSNLS